MTKNPCNWCGKEVKRFHTRGGKSTGKPFKFCSAVCDKKKMGALARDRAQTRKATSGGV